LQLLETQLDCKNDTIEGLDRDLEDRKSECQDQRNEIFYWKSEANEREEKIESLKAELFVSISGKGVENASKSKWDFLISKWNRRSSIRRSEKFLCWTSKFRLS
jgi:hypothetical protein